MGVFGVKICPECKKKNFDNGNYCSFCGISFSRNICSSCSKTHKGKGPLCPSCTAAGGDSAFFFNEEDGKTETFVVSSEGREKFATIREAIKRAKDGARILVKPGIYRENILLTRPVEIIGNGPRGILLLKELINLLFL